MAEWEFLKTARLTNASINIEDPRKILLHSTHGMSYVTKSLSICSLGVLMENQHVEDHRFRPGALSLSMI